MICNVDTAMKRQNVKWVPHGLLPLALPECSDPRICRCSFFLFSEQILKLDLNLNCGAQNRGSILHDPIKYCKLGIPVKMVVSDPRNLQTS